MAWERAGRVPPSGEGNGFGTRYAEDFELYAQYGLAHHRLSIEWARIEPEEGRRDDAAIEHYREVLTAARAAGISPVGLSAPFHACRAGSPRSARAVSVTSVPARTSGRATSRSARRRSAISSSGGNRSTNRTHMPRSTGPAGGHPDGSTGARCSTRSARCCWHNAMRGASCAAVVSRSRRSTTCRRTIAWARRCRRRTSRPHSTRSPGTSGCAPTATACSSSRVACPARSPTSKRRATSSASPTTPRTASTPRARSCRTRSDARVGPMGYAPWSEGLGIVLHRLHDELPGRPLLICEHGVGTDDDEWRCDVLRESLAVVEDAIADGVDLRGFFHWTGVDNYEWAYGFDVQFGASRATANRGAAPNSCGSPRPADRSSVMRRRLVAVPLAHSCEATRLSRDRRRRGRLQAAGRHGPRKRFARRSASSAFDGGTTTADRRAGDARPRTASAAGGAVPSRRRAGRHHAQTARRASVRRSMVWSGSHVVVTCTTLQPCASSQAIRRRSRFHTSRWPWCSNPSHSTASFNRGHAKSRRNAPTSNWLAELEVVRAAGAGRP